MRPTITSLPGQGRVLATSPMAIEIREHAAGEDLDVYPRDEGRKVGSFDTKGYDIKATSDMGMNIRVTFWVTDDVEFDVARYKEMRTALAATQPLQKGLVEALFKIDGAHRLDAGIPKCIRGKTAFDRLLEVAIDPLQVLRHHLVPRSLIIAFK